MKSAEGKDRPPGGLQNGKRMIDHEQIAKRFMRRFIRFPFAGPLRRKIPAIFQRRLMKP